MLLAEAGAHQQLPLDFAAKTVFRTHSIEWRLVVASELEHKYRATTKYEKEKKYIRVDVDDDDDDDECFVMGTVDFQPYCASEIN